MFSKVLVANRGTIRAKCVQTVKELGCTAAVFYTPQDNMSHGVRMADESYEITVNDPTRAYYDVDRIIELAARIDADAVHPGYGFLAENLEFVRGLAERGVKFIGPDEESLARLTKKPDMKILAAKAGMNIIPGSGQCTDFATLQAEARNLGYPLVLKPIASSGGAGMMVVTRESELKTAYDNLLARSDRLKLSIRDIFLEKYLARARHIEVPILRDRNGNMIVLPEIEASIQRRFQKILVETPSPYPQKELLAQISALARRFVDKLDYVGFASVEFLVQDRTAYFLEMNTYIPPWHLATHALTGIDILKEQIRIVAGEQLSLPAAPISPRGHVIGVSVNAEDPARDFVPSPGTISQFEAPLATGAVIYATAKSGDAVSSFYDPVIAQAVAQDVSRESTIKKLEVALSEFIIEGVKTNLPFLRAVLGTPSFREGDATLALVSDRDSLKDVLEGTRIDLEEDIAALIAVLALHNDSNSQEIIDAASNKGEGFSFWNLTSRLLNRNTMDY